MKLLLPWICVVALAAGATSLYLSNSTKETELASLREQAQQAQTLQAEIETTRVKAQAQEAQLATAQKDSQELLRLRNEVRQLRDEKQQLSRQAQTAQAQAERAQAEIVETTARAREQSVQLQARDQLQQRNACINNLRQIDGAKQQWALENNKTAAATPSPQDIAPYLNGNQLPVCPAGGQYTLGIVSKPPVCSIAGHAFPQ
jgi:hypothetical protein